MHRSAGVLCMRTWLLAETVIVRTVADTSLHRCKDTDANHRSFVFCARRCCVPELSADEFICLTFQMRILFKAFRILHHSEAVKWRRHARHTRLLCGVDRERTRAPSGPLPSFLPYPNPYPYPYPYSPLSSSAPAWGGLCRVPTHIHVAVTAWKLAR